MMHSKSLVLTFALSPLGTHSVSLYSSAREGLFFNPEHVARSFQRSQPTRQTESGSTSDNLQDPRSWVRSAQAAEAESSQRSSQITNSGSILDSPQLAILDNPVDGQAIDCPPVATARSSSPRDIPPGRGGKGKKKRGQRQNPLQKSLLSPVREGDTPPSPSQLGTDAENRASLRSNGDERLSSSSCTDTHAVTHVNGLDHIVVVGDADSESHAPYTTFDGQPVYGQPSDFPHTRDYAPDGTPSINAVGRGEQPVYFPDSSAALQPSTFEDREDTCCWSRRLAYFCLTPIGLSDCFLCQGLKRCFSRDTHKEQALLDGEAIDRYSVLNDGFPPHVVDRKIYRQVIIATITLFAGAACMIVLQQKLKGALKIEETGSVARQYTFAVSMWNLASLIFRLAHNVVFGRFTAAQRCFIAQVSMMMSLSIAIALYLVEVSTRSQLFAVGLAFFLEGAGSATFECNIFTAIAPLGDATKVWALSGIPIG